MINDSINRRQFLEKSTVLAGGVLAAACGGSAMATSPIAGGPLTVKLADYGGLQADNPVEIKNASGGLSGVAMTRVSATEVIAFDMACSSDGTKATISLRAFTCPKDGSKFDSAGRVTGGPATKNLPRRSVSYDQTTQILTVS